MRASRLALLLGLAACSSTTTLRVPEVDTAAEASSSETVGARLLREHLDERIRVMRVSWALRTSAPELCGGDLAPDLGVIAWRRNDLALREVKEIAARAFDLGAYPRVLFVHPDSPAGRAGVEVGDALVRLKGERLVRSDLLRTLPREHVGDAPLELEIEREDRRLEVAVAARPVCRHEAELRQDSDLVAARGEVAVITNGLVRFTESDAELAFAIAHRIAHRVLADEPAPRDPQWGSDGAAREVAADRLAAEMVAAAGYDPAAAVGFLERLALERPQAIVFRPYWQTVGGIRTRVTAPPPHSYLPARLVALDDLELAGD